MNDCIVSVLMITYNHSLFIEKAVESVLNQKTNFKFELIISNDKSPDDTSSIVNQIVNSHPRGGVIKFLDNEFNLGPNGNYINAYNHSNSKYIAVCEGDDYWDDELKLQRQVDFLENNPEYVLTYHDAQCIDKSGNLIPNVDNCTPQKEFTSIELQKGKQPLPLTTCYRKVISELPDEMKNIINGDTLLVSLLGGYGKGKWLDIKPAFYRHHSGGVWSLKSKVDKLKSKIDLFTVLHNYYNGINNQKLAAYYSKELKNHIKMLLSQLYKSGEFLPAFKWTLKLVKKL